MNDRSVLFRAVTVVVYAFLLLPIAVVLVASFNDAATLAFPPKRVSLRWFGAFLTSREFLEATRVSLEVAVTTAVAALALGTPAAWLLARRATRSAFVTLQYLTAPLILPGIVVGLALLQFAAKLGASGSLGALTIGHTVVALPYAVRAMHAAFAQYDVTLDEAAATLGARPLRTFLRVTLPLVKPSLIAGGVFAFAISFSNIMVSAFLVGPGTTTLPVRMYNYMEFSNDPTIAAVATLVVLAMFGMVWVLHKTVGLGGFFR
jgi:putative spermidine/putrescine transport system permease protein